MMAQAALLLLAGVASVAYWHFAFHVVRDRVSCGDTNCIRQWVYTKGPVSPPYCWRVLVPRLARLVYPLCGGKDPVMLAFQVVSYPVIAATPLIVWGYVGADWAGFAVALCLLGNIHITPYNVQRPEMSEAMGQAVFFGALWALSVQHPAAWVLVPLCILTRENIGAAASLIAIVWYWPYTLAVALGYGALWLLKRPHEGAEKHPLVSESPWQTLLDWWSVKGYFVIHWTNIAQPLRGMVFALPFGWYAVSEFAQIALVGAAPIIACSVPASGSNRLNTYLLALCAPFAAVCPMPWPWVFALLAYLWPFDWTMWDERGGNFQERRQRLAQRRKVTEQSYREMLHASRAQNTSAS